MFLKFHHQIIHHTSNVIHGIAKHNCFVCQFSFFLDMVNQPATWKLQNANYFYLDRGSFKQSVEIMAEYVSASAVPVSAAKGVSRQNKGENINYHEKCKWHTVPNTVPWVKFFK